MLAGFDGGGIRIGPAMQSAGQQAVGTDEPVHAEIPFSHLIVAGVVIAVTAEIFLLTLNIRPRKR